jgi:hypothetical protein
MANELLGPPRRGGPRRHRRLLFQVHGMRSALLPVMRNLSRVRRRLGDGRRPRSGVRRPEGWPLSLRPATADIACWYQVEILPTLTIWTCRTFVTTPTRLPQAPLSQPKKCVTVVAMRAGTSTTLSCTPKRRSNVFVHGASLTEVPLKSLTECSWTNIRWFRRVSRSQSSMKCADGRQGTTLGNNRFGKLTVATRVNSMGTHRKPRLRASAGNRSTSF